MKISSGESGCGGDGGGSVSGDQVAIASQDAIMLHEKYLDHKHKRKESHVTRTTCLNQQVVSTGIMSAQAGKLVTSTHTQSNSGGGNNDNNDNKWSQNNQQNSISNSLAATSSSSGPAHTQQRQQIMSQHQRQQSMSSSSSINLILSILIGVSLAAIHTSALTSGPAGSPGANPATMTSSSQQMNVASRTSGDSGSANRSVNGAGLAETSGRSSGGYLIQPPPPVTTKPISLDQSPVSINLIPIDQPVSSGLSTTGLTGGQSGTVLPPSGSQSNNNNNNNLRPIKDSYDGSSINLRTTSSSQESSTHPPSQADDFTSTGQLAQKEEEHQQKQHQQQQHEQADDDFSEPIAQFYANTNDGLADPTYQTIIEPQQQQQQYSEKQPIEQQPVAQVKSTSGQLLVSPRQSVERRFGLFKKGHHQQQQHYGLPSMSANYATGPYMSDCERCLASFGQQQQQTADLQQLDPANSLPQPPPPPPTPTVLPVMPSLSGGPGGGHYPMQPFVPLKNKFFMKFPFLIKTSPFSGGGGGGGDIGGQHSYWPMGPISSYQPSYSQQQPSLRPLSSGMSQALFIRPAPAYNCIQASPSPSSPLLQAAASSYTSSQAEVGGSSKTSPVASVKQHQQQQHHYGGHHHHQQQQVQGYARK